MLENDKNYTWCPGIKWNLYFKGLIAKIFIKLKEFHINGSVSVV